MTSKADIYKALAFVNACTGPFQRPFRNALVTRWDIQRNEPGHIKFRVPKFLFPKVDTQHEVLKRVTKVLGDPTESYQEQLRQIYRWDFSTTKALELRWIYQDGTYLSIIDTEHMK